MNWIILALSGAFMAFPQNNDRLCLRLFEDPARITRFSEVMNKTRDLTIAKFAYQLNIPRYAMKLIYDGEALGLAYVYDMAKTLRLEPLFLYRVLIVNKLRNGHFAVENHPMPSPAKYEKLNEQSQFLLSRIGNRSLGFALRRTGIDRERMISLLLGDREASPQEIGKFLMM